MFTVGQHGGLRGRSVAPCPGRRVGSALIMLNVCAGLVPPDRLVPTVLTNSGGHAVCDRYIVCGGWTRSQAFRSAAEHGRLAPVVVRELDEPGAKGAAELARKASAASG